MACGQHPETESESEPEPESEELCPGNPIKPQPARSEGEVDLYVNHTVQEVNKRRKEEILQYPNNSNKLTKAQQYAHTSNNLKFNLAKNFNEEKDVLCVIISEIQKQRFI